jgi:hypothetical protein
MSRARSIDSWLAVDVVRRGISHVAEDCPPSIMITLAPQSLGEYAKVVVDRIWNFCNLHGFETNVEAIEGNMTRYGAIQFDLLRVPPTIGKSVGIYENPSISGTSGGYVRLSKEGFADKICSLTCHHVIARENYRKSILLFFDFLADLKSNSSHTNRMDI